MMADSRVGRDDVGDLTAGTRPSRGWRVASGAAVALLAADCVMLHVSGAMESMLLFLLVPLLVVYALTARNHVGLPVKTRSELRRGLLRAVGARGGSGGGAPASGSGAGEGGGGSDESGLGPDAEPDPVCEGDAYTPRAFRVFTVGCVVVGLALFQPAFCFKSALAVPQVQGYLAEKYGVGSSPSGMEALPESLWGEGTAVYRLSVDGGREARVRVAFDGLASEVEGDDYEAARASEVITGAVLSGLRLGEGDVASCVTWPAGRYSMTPSVRERVGSDGWLDGLPWCSVVFLPHGFDPGDLRGNLGLPGRGTLVVAWLAEGADPAEGEMRSWAESFVDYSGYQGWGGGEVECWDVLQVDGAQGDRGWPSEPPRRAAAGGLA